jgi:co-chaperonin GroES (HSP10)
MAAPVNGHMYDPRETVVAQAVKTNEAVEQLMAVEEDLANVYHAGTVGFEACFDRILVLEDEFLSGYECATCKGVESIACTDCEDGHSRLNPDMKCKSCQGTKRITCKDCQGKGASIIIPDAAKRRPTTGTVVSIGSECVKLERGDKVMYPSFSGEVLDLNGLDANGQEIQVVVRLLREREIICRVTGDLALRRGYTYDNQTSG